MNKFFIQHAGIVITLGILVVIFRGYLSIVLPLAAFTLTVYYFIVSKTACPACHKINVKNKISSKTLDCKSSYSERDFDFSDTSFCVEKKNYKCKSCSHEWSAEKLISKH